MIPKQCNGCGRALLLENLYCDDGCTCNTERGVNFTPKPCDACDSDCCVKPGHRLEELFGLPATGIMNGISCGEVDHHGELELKLTVDSREGSVFISREFWEAIAEKAGWRKLSTDVETSDWTVKDGRFNSSDLFLELQNRVDEIIRESGHQIVNGQTRIVAGIIVATLAHMHGLAPSQGEPQQDQGLPRKWIPKE